MDFGLFCYPPYELRNGQTSVPILLDNKIGCSKISLIRSHDIRHTATSIMRSPRIPPIIVARVTWSPAVFFGGPLPQQLE